MPRNRRARTAVQSTARLRHILAEATPMITRWRNTMGALLLLAAACGTSKPSEQPPPRPTVVDVRKPTPAPSGFYSAQEALRDVLSGELEYIGTGRWPGVERSRACAFRNQRVVIVNAYCTLDEVNAFRIDVYSPERGRVRIYVETSGAVTARQRGDYFTFMVETSPPPNSAARLPPLTLAMPYEELRRYEQQRYEAFLPGCFGGRRNEQPVGGCLGNLASRHDEWAAQNGAFLDRASDDWYRVIRQMRTLASRYGAHPED
jgi:hypothetical protein